MNEVNASMGGEGATEMKASRKVRCTWQRASEMYADVVLEPGITMEHLRLAIDAGRVIIDDVGDDGDNGWLYYFSRETTSSEIELARILKLEQDSVDDLTSFVVRDNSSQPSVNGTLTDVLPSDKTRSSQPNYLAMVAPLPGQLKGHEGGHQPSVIPRLNPREEAMFRVGEAVSCYVEDCPFPTNNHLELAVWATQLRGKISRDDFREVCDNLRHGFSPIGDC